MALSIRRGIIALVQSAAPAAPPANTRSLYPKADGWYEQDSAGREVKIGPGPFTVAFGQNAPQTVTNIPAALAERGGISTRAKVDLTHVTEARISAGINVAANSTAELRIQYATNGDTQSAWDYLDGAGGPGVNIGATGCRTGAWVALAAAAKADVVLRMVSINGDGVADPQYGVITLQFR